MSLFKKKKKETEVITFSVEDARAMVGVSITIPSKRFV